MQPLSGNGTGNEPVWPTATPSTPSPPTPVLLAPAPLRNLLSRFLRRALPQLKVLSHAQVPETKTIRETSLVGAAT
jgi:flagellar biosynthesis component FlhA